MEKIIVIKESPNYYTYLKKLSSKTGRTDNVYQLHTVNMYALRKGKLSDGRKYIIPSGGPSIVQSECIPKTGLFVVDIDQSNLIVILKETEDNNENTEQNSNVL